MSLEISHLVVNGCSFTYCQGLENPQIDGWPAILAKKLGVPVVNIAGLGSGCDGIFRRTMEYYYQNQKLDNNPFYIIAWSHASRREDFFHTIYGKVHDDYANINMNDPRTDYEKELISQYTEKSQQASEQRKYNYWAAILNLFKNNKTNYLTSDFMPGDYIMEDWLEKNYTEIYNYCIKDKYNLKSFSDVTYGHWLPCGHNNEKGNEILADYIYEQLINLYGNVKYIEKDYLKVGPFKLDKTNWDNNKWRNEIN